MRKKGLAGLVMALVVGIALAGCEDTKARQENEQLKAQVAQLTKQNSDLQTNVDGLTKDNAALAQENQQLKARLSPKKKSAKSKKHKRTRASSNS